MAQSAPAPQQTSGESGGGQILLSRYGRAAVLSRYGKRNGGGGGMEEWAEEKEKDEDGEAVTGTAAERREGGRGTTTAQQQRGEQQRWILATGEGMETEKGTVLTEKMGNDHTGDAGLGGK